MTARRVISLLCLALWPVAVAGCGGDTLSFDPVAHAATTTAQSESARVSFTATMNVDGVGGMSFAGAGVFDGRSRSGALNMRFTLPADAQAQLGNVDPTMEMIMDGRHGLVMYMRSPFFRAFAGDKWLKVDMEKFAAKEGVNLSSLLSSNRADPSETLAMLQESADAHPVGYDRVRGVFTTHYTLTIDLKRLADHHKALRDTLKRVRELTGVESFPAEAWIDDQGRVRRMKIDMSFNAPTGAAMTMSLTEDLYAFGLKVNVRPPAASHVVDASALLDRG
jgi:hypothetical protein